MNASHKIEKVLESVPAQQKTYEQLQELGEKNRLSKKFPQINRKILDSVINKWLAKQKFLVLNKDAEDEEQKVYVNHVEVSQDFTYFLVNIHIVEFF